MSWTAQHTGITVDVWPVADVGPQIADSIALGLRRNPRRAHLLVSGVLGKHVPVRASTCLGAGALLASRVLAEATGAGPAADSRHVGRQHSGLRRPGFDVIGFAETATGLGHQVAHGLGAATYVHTTRRGAPAQPDDGPRLSFREEHSHAVEQTFTPRPGTLESGKVAVLVDDEVSTGTTALNAIAAMAPVTGHTRWVLATLLDTRSAADRERCQERAAELGVTLRATSLLGGTVTVEPDSAARAAALAASLPAPTVAPGARADVRIVRVDAGGLALTARSGFSAADDAALRGLAVRAAGAVGDLGDAVVIGDEELMYLPQLVAAALGDLRVGTTTRSPAIAIAKAGYPLRTAVAFDSVSEPGRTAYSYNTATEETLLFVTEDAMDERCRHGVLAALAADGAELVVLELTGSRRC